MLAAGIFVIWAGYGVASWGYLIVKGLNVTPAEWFSPLHPLDWNNAPPKCIPDTLLMPRKDQGVDCANAAASSSGGPPGGGFSSGQVQAA